ncbi:hypothetical protein DZF91_14040 [Actinomadura logoneensis]|uniref:Lipoprotein n=1 Tax=Actinomadura logoneensis TaxID=2293572 RepID=A0A372JLZ6_9ACTN|nr:hypothetical protein [Actinomadura logoneensis]RFU41031.1 hypothetical protein DZF91_14040 [Actinomadura logoneensis]
MQPRIGRRAPATVLLATGLALLTLVASGCGSSDDGGKKGVAAVDGTGAPQGSGGGGGGGGGGKAPSDQQVYDGLLKYAKCMRSHGISRFPDPVLGKGLQVNGNDVGSDTATYKSADAACKSLMPAGGAGDNPPRDRAVALKHAQCMRAHGVVKYPDPNPNGGVNLDGDKIGMTPGNPVFQAAEKACRQFLGATGQAGG